RTSRGRRPRLTRQTISRSSDTSAPRSRRPCRPNRRWPPLPKHPHAQLHLARIAGAALHGAVEVEDQARDLRTMEVLAVERIEDVDGRLDHGSGGVELLRQAQIERRELIVLASEVARGHGAVGVDAI